MPGEIVLVADRNRRFLEKTEEILAKAGYEAVLVRSGDEAADVFGKKKPTIVLAGASLPDRNGYDLIRYVKQRHDVSVSCVIIFGTGEKVREQQAADAGADNWLIRPLKRTELLACLRDMSAIRRLRLKISASRATGPETTDDVSEPSHVGEGIFDKATGFYTFKFFKEVLFREVKRAKRHHFAISLALIAIDPGDTFTGSKAAGEVRRRLLGGLAVAVRQAVRDIDLPVSYTPENVLILMPHTDVQGAHALAERIQQKINRSSLKVGSYQGKPTISIGLASSANLATISFGDLAKAAARGLASAVRAGGNRILAHDERAEAG